MTLLQLIKTIKCVSLSIPNVNSVVDEFLDLNSVDAKYSSVIVQQRNHQKNNDFITFNLYLGYCDRLTENEDNEIEIQSTGIQVINQIIYKLEDLNIDCSLGSYNTFQQRFLALAAGCYAELSITTPIGECEDDFSKEELDTTITANGEYNFIPKGLGYQSVHLNVDVAKLQDKSLDITKNGNYKVQYDRGFSGLKTVDVNVNVPEAEIHNQTKEELITINNKRYTYTPDKNYTGIGKLNVMVQIPEQPIYEEGYVVGKEDGINEQKRKLTYINITQNGTFNREDGYSSVVVDVPIPEIKNQEKNINITENGQTDIVPDTNYTGLSKVGVNVNIDTQSYYDNGYSQGKIDGKTEGIAEQKAKLTDISITENGTYEREDGYKSVVVNVPIPEIKNQEKNITITQNGQTDITPDTDYTGLSSVGVVVNVPSDEKPETELTKTLTANDTYTYTPDEGTVYNKVIITTDIHPTERLTRTYVENNTYIIEGEYNGGEITVNVPPSVPDLRETEITPEITEQIITPDGFDGYNKITVKGVDSSIDSDIKPENIKSGVNILGVEGNLEGVNNQEKSITINSNGTSSVVPDTGYTGIGKMNITVNVPSSGGGGIDLTSLGYTEQENTSINTDIQNTIPYSQSLLENYTDDTIYEHDSYMMFAPLFPCGNRTNFNSFFSECGSLTSIPLLDFSNGNVFKNTFWYCGGLRELPLLDFSKGVDFTATFGSCESLQKLPLLDLSRGQIFRSTFSGCANLQTFPSINVSQGTNFDFFLDECLSLTHVSALDTQRATTFRFMFFNDMKLTTIDELNFSNGQNFTQAFDWCTELTDITFVGSINKSISFEHSTKLSYNSIKSILTACSKTTNTNSKIVAFNRTIADQNNELTNLVATCTSKRWTIENLTITTA